MSDEALVQFKLNLPAGLKKRLEHEAVENRRSLSAEIIRRLEDSFDLGSPSFQLDELPMEQRLKYIVEMAEGLALEVKEYASAVKDKPKKAKKPSPSSEGQE